MFLNLSYGWVALIGFCATCMLCLYQPFVGGIWIGEFGLLSEPVMILLVLLFYSWMFRLMQLTYRDAAGLWTKDWLKPLVAMALKLVSSILLVRLTNSIGGTLLPTVLIMLFIYFPWEARVLYQNLFQRSWKLYLLKMLKYTLLTIAEAGLCYLCCQWIAPDNSFITFCIRLCLVCVVFPSVWIVATWRSDEFRNMIGIAKRFIGKPPKK